MDFDLKNLSARTSRCKAGIDLWILQCQQVEKSLSITFSHMFVQFTCEAKKLHSLTVILIKI